MDEFLVLVLVLGGLAFLLLGALVGWVAWSRERALRKRVLSLEDQVFQLRMRADAQRPEDSVRGRTGAEPVIAPPPATLVRSATGSEAAPVFSARVATPSPPVVPPIDGSHVQPPVPSQRTAASDRDLARDATAIPSFFQASSVSQAEPVGVPAAAAPTSGALPPPLPPRADSPAHFDLERWLGIRGAAVLGGILLIVAGFFFLQYSIELGLITPAWRVAIGSTVGVVCVASSPFLRRRDHVVLANSLTGAGLVLLFAAPWAAYRLYDLIQFPYAFAWMAAATALSGVLAHRNDSQLIAVLGFVGGFATPLVLSTGQDHPVSLFGYVLLLDLGFLFLAQKKRWPSIAMIGLIGTFAIQALWMFVRMRPDSFGFGLVVLGVFAGLFACVTFVQPAAERRGWLPAQTGAVLLPFAFVAYFAQSIEFGTSLWPLAAIACVLVVTASLLARFQGAPWLPIGAASGSLALAFVWLVSRASRGEQSIELLASVGAILLVLQAFAEWKQLGAIVAGSRAAASVGLLGFAIVIAIAAARLEPTTFWSWVIASGVLALLAQRQHAIGAGRFVLYTGSLLAASVCAAFVIDRFGGAPARSTLGVFAFQVPEGSTAPGSPFLLLAFETLFGLTLCWIAARRASAREASVGAALWLIPALWTAWMPVSAADGARVLELALTSALGLVLLLAARGARSGFLAAVAIATTFLVHVSRELWSSTEALDAAPRGSGVLLVGGLTAFALCAWPVIDRSFARASPLAGRCAALAPLPWFFALRELADLRFGRQGEFVWPLLAALVVGVVARVAWVRARADTERGSLVLRNALAASAAFFFCLIVPLQIARTPWPVALALYSVALVALWRRVDSRGLKYGAVLAMLLAFGWLCLERPWDGFVHSERRVWNWLAYLYLVPADAALLGALWLRRSEVERARGFETSVIPAMRGRPLAATVLGLCAVLFVFTWINLEIGDAFCVSAVYRPGLSHQPARDVMLSIAWGIYALVLLVLGVARRMAPVRWASLLLVLTTIAKVFLFDLGHLRGLQRVGSLLGLALSLIVVSLLYQRFVFRRIPISKQPVAPSTPE